MKQSYNGILLPDLKEKNELLIHATTCMIIKYILLTEIRQTQKSACCMIPFIQYSGKGKNYKDRK